MNTTSPVIRSLIAILAASASATAWAHEFWIEPETHGPTPGKVLRVSLHHGERFAGEFVPRDEAKIKRFVCISDDGVTPIVGASGSPISFARTSEGGINVLVYESLGQSIELPAARFEAYLEEEGLDQIVRARAERGESGQPGREVYTRCAKSLLAPRAPHPAKYEECDRIVGLPLEIVATHLPCLGGDRGDPEDRRASFQIRFELAPLRGAAIVLVRQDAPAELLHARTDEAGHVDLTISKPGRWMVTCIHMVGQADSVRDNSGSRTVTSKDADWHSYWASLTFEVKQR